MQGLRNNKGPIPYSSPRGGWSSGAGEQVAMPPGFITSEPSKGSNGGVPAAQSTPRGSSSHQKPMGLTTYAQSPPTTPHQATRAGSAQRSPDMPSQSLMAVMSPRYSHGLGYQSRTMPLSSAGSRHQGMHIVMASPSTSPAATSRPGRSYSFDSLGPAASMSPAPSIASFSSLQGEPSASLPGVKYTSRRSRSISDLRASSVSSLSRISSAVSPSPPPSPARGASPFKEQQQQQQRRPPPINQAVATMITGEANQQRESLSPLTTRSTMAFAGSPRPKVVVSPGDPSGFTPRVVVSQTIGGPWVPSETTTCAEGRRPSFESSTSGVEVRQPMVNGASGSGTVRVSLSTNDADTHHHQRVSLSTNDADTHHHQQVSLSTNDADTHHHQRVSLSTNDADTHHHQQVSLSTNDADPYHSPSQVAKPGVYLHEWRDLPMTLASPCGDGEIAEVLNQRLGDARGECVRLRERIEELEKVADKSIQARADIQMWSGAREDHGLITLLKDTQAHLSTLMVDLSRERKRTAKLEVEGDAQVVQLSLEKDRAEMKIRDLESEQTSLKGSGDRRASISPVHWQTQSAVGGVSGVYQNVAISQLSKKLEEVHNELEGKNNTIRELSTQVTAHNRVLQAYTTQRQQDRRRNQIFSESIRHTAEVLAHESKDCVREWREAMSEIGQDVVKREFDRLTEEESWRNQSMEQVSKVQEELTSQREELNRQFDVIQEDFNSQRLEWEREREGFELQRLEWERERQGMIVRHSEVVEMHSKEKELWGAEITGADMSHVAEVEEIKGKHDRALVDLEAYQRASRDREAAKEREAEERRQLQAGVDSLLERCDFLTGQMELDQKEVLRLEGMLSDSQKELAKAKRELEGQGPLERALARAEARLDEIESASEKSKKQVVSLQKRLAEQGEDAGGAVRMLEESERQLKEARKDTEMWRAAASNAAAYAGEVEARYKSPLGREADALKEVASLKVKVKELKARIRILSMDGIPTRSCGSEARSERGGMASDVLDGGGEGGGGEGDGGAVAKELEAARRKIELMEDQVKLASERERTTALELQGVLRRAKEGEKSASAAMERLRSIECENAALRALSAVRDKGANGTDNLTPGESFGFDASCSRVEGRQDAEESFMDAFARGMLRSGDHVAGVGIILGRSGDHVIIRHVIPGGGAASVGGVHEGDVVESVGMRPVDGMSLDMVMTLLDGPVGTQEKVQIRSKKTGETATMLLPRVRPCPPLRGGETRKNLAKTVGARGDDTGGGGGKEMVGISGLRPSDGGGHEITGIDQGGVACRDGRLEVGDRIVQVDRVATDGMGSDAVMDMIGGTPQSQANVTLTVVRKIEQNGRMVPVEFEVTLLRWAFVLGQYGKDWM